MTLTQIQDLSLTLNLVENGIRYKVFLTCLSVSEKLEQKKEGDI